MDATAGNVLVSPAVYWTRRSTDCWKMHKFYLEVPNLVGVLSLTPQLSFRGMPVLAAYPFLLFSFSVLHF